MEKIKVLDHGYVAEIETWGRGEAGEPEAGIIEAARQSTQGSFRGWELDQKLLAYLFNSDPPHATPFEFAGLVIEVQAPIFVFREWQRHRTQSYNEMSARYSPLPDINYVPSIERIILDIDGNNKQAGKISGANELTRESAEKFRQDLIESQVDAENKYQSSLKNGIPKELARCFIPVSRYSRMRASANLRNWLAFVTLRSDPKAQYDIREYSNVVCSILEKEFPRTYNLWLSKGK